MRLVEPGRSSRRSFAPAASSRSAPPPGGRGAVCRRANLDYPSRGATTSSVWHSLRRSLRRVSGNAGRRNYEICGAALRHSSGPRGAGRPRGMTRNVCISREAMTRLNVLITSSYYWPEDTANAPYVTGRGTPQRARARRRRGDRIRALPRLEILRSRPPSGVGDA